MKKSKDADAKDRDYMAGRRRALLSTLQHCLDQLGYEDAAAKQAAWVLEREEAVAKLRTVCEDHGDNDWDDDLHLADVIEKHLQRYLERP